MTPEPPIDFDFSAEKPDQLSTSAGGEAADADAGEIQRRDPPGATVPARALPPLVGAGMPRDGGGRARVLARPHQSAAPAAGQRTKVTKGICAAIGAILLCALLVLCLRALDRAIRGTAISPDRGFRSGRAA